MHFSLLLNFVFVYLYAHYLPVHFLHLVITRNESSAEESLTRRHLAEFTHLEAEMPFFSFDELLTFLEDFIYTVATSTIEACKTDLLALKEKFGLNTCTEIKRPFRRLNYVDAIKYATILFYFFSFSFLNHYLIYFLFHMNLVNPYFLFRWLNEHGKLNPKTEKPFEIGEDIPEQPERFLVDTLNEPVLMCRFPTPLKAFYMKVLLLLTLLYISLKLSSKLYVCVSFTQFILALPR